MKLFCKKSSSGNGHKVIPYIVYDCSIEDIVLRQQQSLRFDNASDVGRYLGMSHNLVPKYASKEAVAQKRRFFSRKHGKEFAIRVVTEKIKSGSK